MISVEPRQVRDPVHGYVNMTGIERVILESPLAQRLRYISQSSAAHLVFPSMTVTRFVHSLGSMDLVSRFLRATLRNAERPPESGNLKSDLLVDMVTLVSRADEAALPTDSNLTSDIEIAMRRQGLRGVSSNDANQRLATIIVEQALRLVSLLHDLGHLPFSHDFEYALTDHFQRDSEARRRYPNLATATAEGQAIHEKIGRRLAPYIQADVRDRYLQRSDDTALRIGANAAIATAKYILDSAAGDTSFTTGGPTNLARWLYSLVSGEIDVDRCDYILRDARGYGLEGASFDLDRLVDNLCVIRTASGSYDTVILSTGVSVAEEFFVARYRLYQWAVYHHKIQQASAGLRLALRRELSTGGPTSREFLDDLELILTPHDGGPLSDEATSAYSRFSGHDDHRWVELFKQNLQETQWQRHNADIDPWLRLFVYRQSGPWTLWKRPMDLSPDQLSKLNAASFAAATEPDRAEPWRESVQLLEEEGLLVAPLNWKPWRPMPEKVDCDDMDSSSVSSVESSFQVVNLKDGSVIPLSRASTLVNALRTAWDSTIQVLVFARSQSLTLGEAGGSIDAGTVIDRLTNAN